MVDVVHRALTRADIKRISRARRAYGHYQKAEDSKGRRLFCGSAGWTVVRMDDRPAVLLRRLIGTGLQIWQRRSIIEAIRFQRDV